MRPRRVIAEGTVDELNDRVVAAAGGFCPRPASRACASPPGRSGAPTRCRSSIYWCPAGSNRARRTAPSSNSLSAQPGGAPSPDLLGAPVDALRRPFPERGPATPRRPTATRARSMTGPRRAPCCCLAHPHAITPDPRQPVLRQLSRRSCSRPVPYVSSGRSSTPGFRLMPPPTSSGPDRPIQIIALSRLLDALGHLRRTCAIA